MMYDILVTIKNSPNKTNSWGFLIKANDRQEAVDKALEYAKANAMKPYSRFKKCTFAVEDKNIIEKLNW